MGSAYIFLSLLGNEEWGYKSVGRDRVTRGFEEVESLQFIWVGLE